MEMFFFSSGNPSEEREKPAFLMGSHRPASCSDKIKDVIPDMLGSIPLIYSQRSSTRPDDRRSVAHPEVLFLQVALAERIFDSRLWFVTVL
jgi:hypothetical protein